MNDMKDDFCLLEALKNYPLMQYDITDEEMKEIINISDKWNSIGCTSFRLSSEEIKEIMDKYKEILI